MISVNHLRVRRDAVLARTQPSPSDLQPTGRIAASDEPQSQTIAFHPLPPRSGGHCTCSSLPRVLPGEGRSAITVDLCRVRRRQLEIGAAESGNGLVDHRLGHIRHLTRSTAYDDIATTIQGCRADTELDVGLVLFFCRRQKLRKPGRLADDEWENSGCKRIECAGVTDFLAARRARITATTS